MGNASSLLFSALFTYQIFDLNYSELHAFPIHFAFFPPFFSHLHSVTLVSCQTLLDYLRPPCNVTVLHSLYLLVSFPATPSKQRVNKNQIHYGKDPELNSRALLKYQA